MGLNSNQYCNIGRKDDQLYVNSPIEGILQLIPTQREIERERADDTFRYDTMAQTDRLHE